jgi:hydrogenase expression/formation protein HypE
MEKSNTNNHQNINQTDNFCCPVSLQNYSVITLAHGSGGRLTYQLIQKIFGPAFINPELDTNHDSAILTLNNQKLAFTTDSYTVSPLFFPGGDIGKLAITGTVNDLAMAGARPLWLSAGFIIEEGLPVDVLTQIVESMKHTAKQAGVNIVTGDTKVVDKGKGDGVFINTSGVGIIEHNQKIHPSQVKAGDVVIINGDIGRHGIAIMIKRSGLQLESAIQSDCALLNGLVFELINSGVEIHCMRDLTRGGLATALIEISRTSNTLMTIEEANVPVIEDVKSACELLGLDPLYVANEGRMIAIVPEKHCSKCLDIMKKHKLGLDPAVIGSVDNSSEARVLLRNSLGTTRILEMLTGEQLPRIC